MKENLTQLGGCTFENSVRRACASGNPRQRQNAIAEARAQFAKPFTHVYRHFAVEFAELGTTQTPPVSVERRNWLFRNIVAVWRRLWAIHALEFATDDLWRGNWHPRLAREIGGGDSLSGKWLGIYVGHSRNGLSTRVSAGGQRGHRPGQRGGEAPWLPSSSDAKKSHFTGAGFRRQQKWRRRHRREFVPTTLELGGKIFHKLYCGRQK